MWSLSQSRQAPRGDVEKADSRDPAHRFKRGEEKDEERHDDAPGFQHRLHKMCLAGLRRRPEREGLTAFSLSWR